MNKELAGGFAAVALASGLFAATTANAASVINNTGIANPAETITFSEFTFATGTPITNQFASLGATFSPALYYDVQAAFFPGDFLANFDLNGDTSNPASIFFTSDQTAAAFALQTNAGTTSFEALENGVEVDSFTAATTDSLLPDLSQASNFYGFTGVTFNQIMITSNTTYFQMDDLQFSNVGAPPAPEPASLTLLGVGLAGLGFLRRRKRA